MIADFCYAVYLHEFRNRGRCHNWIYMSQRISHQIFYLHNGQSMYFLSSIANLWGLKSLSIVTVILKR